MKRLTVCLLLLLTVIVPVYAQDAACSSAELPHLNVGQWARVAHDTANNLRQDPDTSSTKIGNIPGGDIFRVLAGPQCAEGYAWWQVSYGGQTGWTAEGDAAGYWLEPLAGQPDTSESGVALDPEGCLRPPEDYTRVPIGDLELNARTLAMLDRAQELYRAQGGTVDFRLALMQGSYNPGAVAASFGTHDGGGAIDLSVRSRVDWSVLGEEIWPMIRALRVAGFAAWLRDTGELGAGSPIHIHAIAIGDAELSEAARDQLDGPFGYLRGYNGLPQAEGQPPLPDTSGEMVICQWMIDDGFDRLTTLDD
ncbi:MAG TPA: SH3 domain-containing protein [Phototrophicaceae bacterium]|nr:SH3 domain-containing protein [Phototrophicaceae bacterium]